MLGIFFFLLMVRCFLFILYRWTFKGKQPNIQKKKKAKLTDILQICNSAGENRIWTETHPATKILTQHRGKKRARQAILKLRNQGELDHLIICLEAVPNIWRQTVFAARNFSTSSRRWVWLEGKKSMKRLRSFRWDPHSW